MRQTPGEKEFAELNRELASLGVAVKEPPELPKLSNGKPRDVRPTFSEHVQQTRVPPSAEPHAERQPGEDPPEPEHVTQTPPPKPPRFKIMTAAELAAWEDNSIPLIENVMEQGEFAIWVGPKKGCKTTLALLTAMHIVIGRPLFGMFKIPKRLKVAFFSGECGRRTLKDMKRRIAGFLGRSPADFDGLHFSFELPLLDSRADLVEFERLIVEHGWNVIFLDCFYRMLGSAGDDAKNVFKMGSILGRLMDIQQRSGSTIVLLHHTRMHASNQEPDLDDAAFSGVGEAARQWVLVNRRVKYDPTRAGHHELWWSVGGSMGQSELLSINIEEGSRKDPGGRRFEMEIMSAGEARTEARATREQQKQADESTRIVDGTEKVLAFLQKRPDGETKTGISDGCGMNRKVFGPVLARLIDDGKVVACEFTKNRRREHGYKAL